MTGSTIAKPHIINEEANFVKLEGGDQLNFKKLVLNLGYSKLEIIKLGGIKIHLSLKE